MGDVTSNLFYFIKEIVDYIQFLILFFIINWILIKIGPFRFWDHVHFRK
jgi:hypothetical protein